MSSFIEMNSQEVIRLAENKINNIKEYRNKRRVRYVEKQLKSKFNRFIWWITGSKIPTVEELIEQNDKYCGIWSDWVDISCACGYIEMVAEELIQIAKKSPKVFISAIDYDYIKE